MTHAELWKRFINAKISEGDEWLWDADVSAKATQVTVSDTTADRDVTKEATSEVSWCVTYEK